jgi:hypothetical protein
MPFPVLLFVVLLFPVVLFPATVALYATISEINLELSLAVQASLRDAVFSSGWLSRR